MTEVAGAKELSKEQLLGAYRTCARSGSLKSGYT